MKTCEKCNKTLEDKNNFCPSCGNPVSPAAKNLVKQQAIRNKLEILMELAPLIHDTASLELIKRFITRLKEEI